MRARNRGTTRFLIGSTPSTCSASSSSRIFRAPRSAVIAVPATPATTTAVTSGANSRTEAHRDHRDHHRKPAELEGEEELPDELAPVGIRRPDGGEHRLRGQNEHVPDLLEERLGRKEGPVGEG